ncbi:MAG: NADP-dependent malic enzyme [Candidatus Micrarchaeaceae archaeon]|nr:NADP-dependent malic enzyme [Candidatus Parvarchaeota archaeon]MCW1295922.1 NADP-dependent malic enzyme [Candidatus Parvarchaeum tengchongense]MCW1312037.1 NADP-dependent malic enzyme [Candidatus Parvarchaeum tengchongense]
MDKEPDYSKLALEYSKKHGGKIELKPTLKIKSLKDLSIVYTPGVAAVSTAISNDSRLSWDLTWRWNTIFIITNGTRVLGLGDIGPLASLPVMEGKSLIYKEFGGVNAIPIPIETKEVDEFVNVVKNISVTSGGIHLEDIESPFCFEVLERLQEELKVPVWHDDQQGTAAATLAGLINATKLTGKDLKRSRIVMIGAGAANIALFRILEKYGVDTGNIIIGDSKGPLYNGRDDMEIIKTTNRWKYEIMKKSNKDSITDADSSFEGADIVVGFSREGGIKPEWIRKMSSKPIVFANANPNPEISPEEAYKAGAYIVSTGRSDYPNQINNSLIFPALFRGVLDSKAKKIDDYTAIAAAEELAKFAQEKGLRKDYIVPNMEEREIYPRIAATVAEDAVKRGLSDMKESREYFYKKAKKIIGLK